MNPELEKIIWLLNLKYQTDISVYDRNFLHKALEKRLILTSCVSAQEYSRYLSDNVKEAEEFFESLSIIYSEFFRNNLTFSILEQHILPRLIADKEKTGNTDIRVWSAGCAEGQEAYSIAILLNEIFNSSLKHFHYLIFATDKSLQVLKKAEKGIFDEIAVKNIPVKFLNKYFTNSNGKYTITDVIRHHIDFSHYNMLNKQTLSPPAGIFGNFDLVICSNLLLYYNSEARHFILDKVYGAIAEKGYLVTGETEKEIVEKEHIFNTAFLPAPIYQKLIS